MTTAPKPPPLLPPDALRDVIVVAAEMLRGIASEFPEDWPQKTYSRNVLARKAEGWNEKLRLWSIRLKKAYDRASPSPAPAPDVPVLTAEDAREIRDAFLPCPPGGYRCEPRDWLTPDSYEKICAIASGRAVVVPVQEAEVVPCDHCEDTHAPPACAPDLTGSRSVDDHGSSLSVMPEVQK